MGSRLRFWRQVAQLRYSNSGFRYTRQRWVRHLMNPISTICSLVGRGVVFRQSGRVRLIALRGRHRGESARLRLPVNLTPKGADQVGFNGAPWVLGGADRLDLVDDLLSDVGEPLIATCELELLVHGFSLVS